MNCGREGNVTWLLTNNQGPEEQEVEGEARKEAGRNCLEEQ
jgi:hypothetical protein